MTHYSNVQIGERLLAFGSKSDATLDALITGMAVDRTQVCLLAAMLQQLRQSNETTENLLRNILSAVYRLQDIKETGVQDSRNADDPSEGMLRGMLGQPVGFLIQPYLSSLSVRAQNAVKAAKVQYTNEITWERFDGVRSCGEKTVNELLALKARLNAVAATGESAE